VFAKLPFIKHAVENDKVKASFKKYTENMSDNMSVILNRF